MTERLSLLGIFLNTFQIVTDLVLIFARDIATRHCGLWTLLSYLKMELNLIIS